MLKKTLIAALIVASSFTSLTACSNATPDITQTTATPEHLNHKDFTKIIDVRSEPEYAKEHLEDAILINIQSATFEQQLNELNKRGNYYVYSNGGGRSASAIKTMKDLDFTGILVNGGSINEASRQLELPIVKPAEPK